MVKDRVVTQVFHKLGFEKLGTRRHLVRDIVTAVILAATMVAGTAATTVTTASAHFQPTSSRDKPTPPLVDGETLTAGQVSTQIKAAEALRAKLMRSGAEVAAASSRLERLSSEANALLAGLSAARTAQAAARTEAAAQRARLIQLGLKVQGALDALGRLASDSYIQGGGPLGDMVAILEALSAPSADQSADSMTTVQYLIAGRARVFDRLRSLRADQALTAARAEAASERATAATRKAAEAKSRLDTVIAQQRSALAGFRGTQTDQIGRAARLRGNLLRSEGTDARAADRRLAQALHGRDFKLLRDESSSCGKGSANYPNGRLPASALCPLYAAPGESLTRAASIAFNAMSNAYQRHSGSALCVTDGYRSYAEQVAVKLARPRLAAQPGHSQHGLGLAVDLCGGVQNFANPAHLWMQRNAPLYGWFHPGWAEPSGVLPEPWHWEFAS